MVDSLAPQPDAVGAGSAFIDRPGSTASPLQKAASIAGLLTTEAMVSEIPSPERELVLRFPSYQ
jgi:hypothetical protein